VRPVPPVLMITVVLALPPLGCGDGGDPGNATRPPPGTSAEGWLSDYAEGSAGAACDADEAELAHLPHVTIGDTTLYVGFEQVSGINQDPIVARFDGGERVWCVYHETDPPDGRAEGITWDGGDHAYVVYTIVGGGSGLEGHGGWLSSYAPGAIHGGGPKVSVVGRIDVADGALDTATFVIAVLSDNRVNTHGPSGAVTVLEDGHVEFMGSSAHKPIDADGQSAMDCSDYPFDSRYRFSADLGTLVCADCTNCVSQEPCD
jgi:hypothetical protein